jgi:hypothetical protein
MGTTAPIATAMAYAIQAAARPSTSRVCVRPTMIASSIRFSTARLKCRRGGACSILSRSNRSGHLFGRPWIAEEPGCRRHGEVIDLVYFHGKSVKEVAEIVGIANSTKNSSARAGGWRISGSLLLPHDAQSNRPRHKDTGL